jgi:hypothetical protein
MNNTLYLIFLFEKIVVLLIYSVLHVTAFSTVLTQPQFTQPLTEMSTRSRRIMFLESRARPVRRADSLTAICEPTV